jgi:hypothetical protein
MPDVESCQQPARRDDWHTRWLEMQAAYGEYRRSSEALECTRHSSDDADAGDYRRMAMLEGQQRLAFERYVDARIAFLESRFDEMNRPETGGSAPHGAAAAAVTAEAEKESRIKSWVAVASSRPVLQTLAVLLLCTMSFSLMREQKRVRELEARRDEIRAAPVQMGQELQGPRQKLDASKPAAAPAPLVQLEPSAPVKDPAASTRARASQPQAARHARQQQKASANRVPGREPTRRIAEGRASYDFSLARSREYKRVGPLSIWVKSIDPQTRSVSLSILSENIEVNVPSMKIDQPIWVRTAHGHRVGLVADRITANRLEGHLIENANGDADLRASRTRPTVDRAP